MNLLKRLFGGAKARKQLEGYAAAARKSVAAGRDLPMNLKTVPLISRHLRFSGSWSLGSSERNR